MENVKNLCAQIPISLHAKVREEQEKSGQSLSVYITQLLTDYYENQNRKGEKTMEFNKTLAFQVPETLFNRIKDHLERETKRTGKRLTQRDFVIGLIERALEEAERQEAGEAGEQESGQQEAAETGEEAEDDADMA